MLKRGLIPPLGALTLALVVMGCRSECVAPSDCVSAKGAPQPGFEYACVQSQCVFQESTGGQGPSDGDGHQHHDGGTGERPGTDAGTGAPPDAGQPPAPGPDTHIKTDAKVTSFDGTSIAITVFQPAGSSVASPVPVILWSHGWGGSRQKDFGGRFTRFLDAGYGIVSIDARGFGESGGQANVHNREVEVKDFQAVLDWTAENLPWVAREHGSHVANDILVGASGGSYGGGFQLMTASFDGRLDALTPEITWNDLTYSLAPYGALKSVWLDFLYGLGKARGRVSPKIDEWYAQAMLLNNFPPEAFDHFKASSPVPEAIQAPTLLIQGVPDQLFNLNEAVRTYQAMRSVGTEVRLFTHLTGHVLPGVQPIGVGGGVRTGSPCGSVDDIVIAWFDKHLKGLDVEVVPPITLALEDGKECVRLEDPTWPPAGASVVATAETLPAFQGAGSVLMPVLQAKESTVVAGIGHVKATVTAATETILHFSLVAQTSQGVHVVDDQATGYRVKLPAGSTSANIELELAGVATRLNPGDQLLLRVEGANEWFVTNGSRLPGPVALSKVTVTVPTIAQ